MYEIAMIGFLSALGAFILLWKINLAWFCRFHWQTDLIFAALVTWLFFGTFSGMATAAVAGVAFSGFLYVAKMIESI
jgi:hypothetical protein